MAEERTLGIARAQEYSTEEPSKEELQRRMDEARDSISNTVTEIKETVANQVQAVKDTLDWREQYRRRPVAWSLGALGVGFAVGCGVANLISDDDSPDYRDSRDVRDYYGPDYRSYAAQPVLSHASASMKQQSSEPIQGGNGHAEDKGPPGLVEKLTQSTAYGRVKDEVGDIGNSLIQELTKTAKVMVVPAIIGSLKKFLGEYLPDSSGSSNQGSRRSPEQSHSETPRAQGGSSYQPALERNQ